MFQAIQVQHDRARRSIEIASYLTEQIDRRPFAACLGCSSRPRRFTDERAFVEAEGLCRSCYTLLEEFDAA